MSAVSIAAMERLRLLVSVTFVVAAAVLCQRVISNSVTNQADKNDYAELSNVRYGLFSVGEWRRQIVLILAAEIETLHLSGANEEELRKHVEVQLNTLINEVDKRIRLGNKDSAGGQIKQAFIDLFVSLEDVKKGLPAYADAVIREMKKEKSTNRIRALLTRELECYSSQTPDTQDMTRVRGILLRTGTRDAGSAKGALDSAISAGNRLILRDAALLVTLAVALFALSGLGRKPLVPSEYLLLVLSLALLLLAGVTTPMIDMEAGISRMTLVLMGHPVSFENQVLYFQSKSILDVFRIMITHKDFQMKCVGVLVITFSVLLPMLKIASSLGYYYNYRRAREHPAIRFLVLQSGKWSMADVTVVAIFMAYVGMNGIIDSQFAQMRSASPDVVILTTNGTSLQPGYFLFLTYTLLALFLSGFLTRGPQAARCEAGAPSNDNPPDRGVDMKAPARK